MTDKFGDLAFLRSCFRALNLPQFVELFVHRRHESHIFGAVWLGTR